VTSTEQILVDSHICDAYWRYRHSFHKYRTKIGDTLHEDRRILVVISNRNI